MRVNSHAPVMASNTWDSAKPMLVRMPCPCSTFATMQATPMHEANSGQDFRRASTSTANARPEGGHMTAICSVGADTDRLRRATTT